MALLVTEAIVLHAFDYLESSRIVRLVTRDGGMRSALAKGARKSRRRFGSGLDLFAQGTASLHVRSGRDLDTLSAFEDVRPRTELATHLERFTGAEALAEIALRFGREGADADVFNALAAALDAIGAAPAERAGETTLAGVWQLVASLGFAPAVDECAECYVSIAAEDAVLFTHSAGGVRCARCGALAAGGRRLPASARAALSAWIGGAAARVPLTAADARAHQRLLREFLDWHLHDGRPLRALEMWERESSLRPPDPSPVVGATGDSTAA